MESKDNVTILNKLKRIFGGGVSETRVEEIEGSIEGLIQRIDALEANTSDLNSNALGFKINGVYKDVEFEAAATVNAELAIDRYSEVGNLSIDTDNVVLPTGFTLGSVSDDAIVKVEIIYDGSQANGTYSITIALIGEDNSTDTITFDVTVNA